MFLTVLILWTSLVVSRCVYFSLLLSTILDYNLYQRTVYILPVCLTIYLFTCRYVATNITRQLRQTFTPWERRRRRRLRDPRWELRRSSTWDGSENKRRAMKQWAVIACDMKVCQPISSYDMMCLQTISCFFLTLATSFCSARVPNQYGWLPWSVGRWWLGG